MPAHITASRCQAKSGSSTRHTCYRAASRYSSQPNSPSLTVVTMTSTTSCTTVLHTIKIVICRSTVVVHTTQHYSTSTLVTPKEEHATRLHCTTELAVETLSTTEPTQQDSPQSALQHRTPPAHHHQEYRQPTALLRTTGCSGGLTGLLPRRISRLSGNQVAQDGPTCLQPRRNNAQLRTTSCPERTHSSAGSPDHSAHLRRPTTQAPRCQ